MLYDDLLMKEAEYLDSLSPAPLSPSAYYHFDTPAPPTPASSSSSASSSSRPSLYPTTVNLSSSSSTASAASSSSSFPSLYSHSSNPYFKSSSLSSDPSRSASSSYVQSYSNLGGNSISQYAQPEQSLDDALEMARSTYYMLLDWMADLVQTDIAVSDGTARARIMPDLDAIDTRAIMQSIRTQKDEEERELYVLQEAEIRRVNRAIIEQAEVVRVLSGRVASANASAGSGAGRKAMGSGHGYANGVPFPQATSPMASRDGGMAPAYSR